MEECTDDPFVPRPNRITYNTCLKAMRNGSQEEAARAEQILTSLEERAAAAAAAAANDNNSENNNNGSDDDLYPDTYSYTAVISAYGRSDAPHKASAARAVLQRMVCAFDNGNRLARPNVHAFNAALNACAFSQAPQQSDDACAFRVALDILQLLHCYTTADHTTYGTMLRACSSLLPVRDPQRERAVTTLFHRARSEGQVGRLVVKQLRFAASPELYKSLLLGRDISETVVVQDLPRKWSCNVRENNRRAKKLSHDNHSRRRW
jgi:chorismate mutase